MFSSRDNLIGIAAMLVAMIGFVSNDTQVKLASESLPLGEVMFLRGVATVLIITAIVFMQGHQRHLRLVRHRGVFWRTVGEVVASILFLTALTHLPLPNATIIMQAAPLVITAIGALFLGHIVHWRRWTAIAIGFIGVVIVMRPGFEGFNAYSLLALSAVLFVALRDLSTRTIPRTIPTVLIVAVACVTVMLAGAGMGLVLGEAWQTPDIGEALLMIGAASCLIVGYWFVTLSMRTGDPAINAEFRYSVIVWATLYGFLIWGDRPDLLTWTGTAIIILSGLYTFHRERRLARRRLAG